MKSIYISLTIWLACLCFENTFAQQYTMCGSDTIKISLDNYQIGTIEWQESYDSTNWVTIENEHELVLKYYTTEEIYLRAVATTSTCEQVTTFSVFIQQKPVAYAGIDQEIAGDKVMLNGNFAPYTSGFWAVVNGTGGTLTRQDSLSTILAGNLNSDYTLTWTLNNSCGTNIDSVRISFIENVFNQNFIIVDATDSILSDSILILQGIYQIQFSEIIAGINDSCLLIGISGDGFLRKVISFEKLNDSLYIFYTEQAYWEDYCESGVLNIGNNMIPGNNNPKSHNQLVSVDVFPTRREILTDPKYKTGTFIFTKTDYYQVGQRLKSLEADDDPDRYVLNFPSIEISALAKNDESIAKFNLDGKIEFLPNFVLNFKKGNDPIMLGFNNSELENTLKVNFDINLISGFVKTKWKPIVIFKKKTYKIIVLFGAPVLVVTDFILDLKGSLNGHGSFMSEIVFNSKTNFSSYLYYQDGAIKTYSDKSRSTSVNVVNSHVEGEIGVEFKLEPTVKFKLFSLAGPYISFPVVSIEPSICVGYKEVGNIIQNPWTLKADVSVDATLGLEFGISKKLSVDISHTFNILKSLLDKPGLYIPDKLTLTSGNNQFGNLNQKLKSPLQVRVISNLGFGVPYVPVWFDVLENNGKLEKSMVLTDAKGYAHNYLTLGSTEKLNRVKVYTYNCSFENLANSPVYFSANCTTGGPSWICQNSSLVIGLKSNPDLTVEPYGILGVKPYSYSLDGIAYSSTIPKIALNLAENQQFFVMDANGCTSSTVYKSKSSCDYNPPQIAMSITGNNIQAYGSKGSPPYIYSIDIDGSYTSLDRYNGLGSGDHTLYIMDSKGCKNHKDFTISNSTKNGLVAHYPFNRSAIDVSGNGYNGTVQGASTTTDRLGNSNNAYQFTTNNDYIEIPSNALNNMPNGTVAAFIYLDKLGVQHSIIDKTITTSINYFQFIVDENNTLRTIINSNGVVYRGNTALSTNQWYHVAVTWDGTNTRLFLNGIQDGIYPNVKGIPDADRHTYIGKVENNTAYMKGKIDEVKIFNRALTESEIFELYHENGWGYNSPLTSSVKDVDGNMYKTVKIGNQWWMAENLKTTKYNDGTSIPLVTDNTAWGALSSPRYCWYNNDVSNKNTYGALYNWFVVNTGKLAPVGWHVPTVAEWTILTDYLGGVNIAGGKLKEAGTSHWQSPNQGATNETGFTALPGGYRSSNGTFELLGGYGDFWQSTGYDATNAYYRVFYPVGVSVPSSTHPKVFGDSVRCVKD